LKAVEESLPEFLREKRGEAARSEHPAGEVFFRGNAEEITDEQAEEIARRQLERSGLLRGAESPRGGLGSFQVPSFRFQVHKTGD